MSPCQGWGITMYILGQFELHYRLYGVALESFHIGFKHNKGLLCVDVDVRIIMSSVYNANSRGMNRPTQLPNFLDS